MCVCVCVCVCVREREREGGGRWRFWTSPFSWDVGLLRRVIVARRFEKTLPSHIQGSKCARRNNRYLFMLLSTAANAVGKWNEFHITK